MRRRLRGRRAVVAAVLVSLSVGSGGAMAASSGGASAPSGAKAVRKAGVSVASLQRALGITADGVYGPATRRAVRRFQRSHGLAVDGIAGPATLAALGLKGSASTSDPASKLAEIAQCESGGDPTAISADGRYRGKYQFTRSTWHAMGGKGDPAKAPESVQDRLAAALLAARGTSPWPVCG